MPENNQAREERRNTVQKALVEAFLKDPDLALDLWHSMGWTLTTPLLDRENRQNAQKQRTVAEATNLAHKATEQLQSGPEPVQQLESFLAARPHNQLKQALLSYKNDSAQIGMLESALRQEFSANVQLAGDIWNHTNWPRPVTLVMQTERAELRKRLDMAAPQAEAANMLDLRSADGTVDPAYRAVDAGDLAMHEEVVGLAFSGGGIRSATFNLGVLQALAENGLLKRIDYLSTVSGGGYIGAWLAGWVKRLGWVEVERLLSPKTSPDPQANAQKPVRFLRQFSNYLTPSLGPFSADTWTMGAVYLRNLILNQTTLIACIGALLLVPRLWEQFMARQDLPAIFSAWFPRLASGLWVAWARNHSCWPAVAFFVFAVGLISRNLSAATADCTRPADGPVAGVEVLPEDEPAFTGRGWVLTAVTSLIFFITLATGWFWENIGWIRGIDVSWSGYLGGWKTTGGQSGVTAADFWASFWGIAWIVLFLLSIMLSAFGGLWKCFKNRLMGDNNKLAWCLILFIALLTSGIGLGLVRGYVEILHAFFVNRSQGGIWHATVLGPPLLLGVIALTGMFQIGLMGLDFPDSGREWLSRYHSLTNIYIFFWLALFGAAIYGPLLFAWLGYKSKFWVAGLGTGWVTTTIGSLFAAKSGQTGKTKEGAPTFSKTDLLAKVGPPVFLVGFLVILSVGEHLLLSHARLNATCGFFENLYYSHWTLLDKAPVRVASEWPVATVLYMFAAMAIAGIILLWRVDINDFSMHHFYKNRLVRAYLGASHPNRKPNSFTGFDSDDDFHLTELKPTSSYTGPYQIINATLNLSAGGQLAWQERQASSFAFTPCFSGYDLARDSDHLGPKPEKTDLKYCAYRPTGEYGYKKGIRTGTAMAISGAAANPNHGYHTSTTVAFLMTVFDVRLGWWMGNPRRDGASKLASPRFGLKTLIDEMLGLTDDRASFVSLSDGGHFDNMGIYELVRRRCKYIVLCDAEQDGLYKFSGLGTVIRRCRVDFGAEIDIEPTRAAPEKKTQFSGAHCAVGTIRYVDGAEGVLIYIKSSLTGDEPADILEYKSAQPEFPHESTADQWFGESQFESYRKLGYHAAKTSFQPALAQVSATNVGPKRNVFEMMGAVWYPLNPAVQKHASKHTKTYNDLMDLLRTNASLHSLGDQLFPNNGLPPAAAAGDPRERFFFCVSLIQLLEDIYSDFGLESPLRLNDPRVGGWVNLYREWQKVPAIATTWNAVKSSYRQDFQAFWDDLAPKD